MARRQSKDSTGFFSELVHHQTYKDNLKTRLHAGILPPNLEIRVLEYVFGKPPDEINLTVEDFSGKSTEELIELTTVLQSELRQLRELSATIH